MIKRIKQFFTFKRSKIGEGSPRPWWKYVLYGFAGLFGLGIFSVLAVLAWILPQLPDLDDLEYLEASESSIITDREGNELYRLHGDQNRIVVPFEAISPNIVQALLAMEDDKFYEHGGFDVPAIIKAVCAEVGLCSQARGGSTITQQFITNSFLTRERTYTRKLKELILSIKLENKYTKDEILALYLNRIGYVSNIHGVELASQTFFKKRAKDLDIAEAAVLASLPKSPTYYSPYGSHLHPKIVTLTAEDIFKLDLTSEQDIVNKDPALIEKGLLGKTYTFTEGEKTRDIYVKGRVDFVIERMLELGYIDEKQAAEAIEKSQNLVFEPIKQNIKAPHFVFYVSQLLEEQYGLEKLQEGGLIITTTLRPDFQEAAEKAIADQAEKNAKSYGANNAGLVSIDPDTGEILAMVGSRDFNNVEIQGQNNMTTSLRSPGSSIKPIVYAAAFSKGYAPGTVVYDVKTSFGGWYTPNNYDGTFKGPITFRKALGSSLNIPAIKAAYLAGLPNVLELARKMGLELPLSDADYGLSLALGAGEVSPLNMAKAYSMFANGGYDVTPVAVLKITDRNGAILQEHKAPEKKTLILDPQVAYLITDVLSDRSVRPGAYWRDILTIPGQINAAKTGTSNGKDKNGVNKPQDLWTVGYTRHLTTAVWVGNTDGTLMPGNAESLTNASPIWKNYMVQATKDMPKTVFEIPEGIKWAKVSKRSGKPASSYTPAGDIVNEIFASFSLLTGKDDSYRVVEIDKVSGKLATEYTPEEAREKKAFYVHSDILPENEEWQKAVRSWAAANGQDEQPPTEYDDIHTAESMANPPRVDIVVPVPNATVAPPTITVQAAVKGDRYIKQVDYYWNGQKVGTATAAPYSLRIAVPESAAAGSVHTLKAVAMDDWYRTGQGSTSITIGTDKNPPNLSFNYPKSGSELTANSVVTIQANANDDNGAVKTVEAWVNGASLGALDQAPYSWSWKPTEMGDYTLKLTASDYVGNSKSIDETVKVKAQASGVEGSSRLTGPGGGQFAVGQSIPVTVFVSAEDMANLSSIEILAKPDGAAVGKTVTSTGATAGSQTYTLVWAPSDPGKYELYAKLVSGANGNYTQRTTVEVK